MKKGVLKIYKKKNINEWAYLLVIVHLSTLYMGQSVNNE